MKGDFLINYQSFIYSTRIHRVLARWNIQMKFTIFTYHTMLPCLLDTRELAHSESKLLGYFFIINPHNFFSQKVPIISFWSNLISHINHQCSQFFQWQLTLSIRSFFPSFFLFMSDSALIIFFRFPLSRNLKNIFKPSFPLPFCNYQVSSY